jgi:hypothetical protein
MADSEDDLGATKGAEFAPRARRTNIGLDIVKGL